MKREQKPGTGTPAGVQIKVKVLPRSARSEVAGWMGETLKIKLTAPPVEGEANAALLNFLAEALGVKKTAVDLVKGKASQNKVVYIAGMSMEEVVKRLK